MINKEIADQKYLTEVLTKMCDMVGVNVNKIDFKKPQWFWKHTWTKNQEKEFKKWFVNYLYRRADRQREIFDMYGYYSCPKYRLKEYVDGFIFQFGWRTETEEERKKRIKDEKLKEIESL
jgi:hypothetical protein